MQSIVERAGLPVLRMLRGFYESVVHGFPLFQREMIEQSHRGRTFILRAAFACSLFFVALLYSSAQSGTSLLATSFGMTGQGRLIMDSMVWMLFLGIYLFGPALACGSLTVEKERDTLTLLYLTRLGPWQIVLEKFLSRMVPMFAILLLALPLLAFAYAFGGLTRSMIGNAMWFLSLTVIQVTAVSVMCSAICRNTAKSFLWTYSVLFLMSFGLDTADHWLFEDQGLKALERWEADAWKPQRSRLLSKTYEVQSTLATGQVSAQNMQLSRTALLYPLCGPALFREYGGLAAWSESTFVSVTLFYREIPISFNSVTFAGIPILISSMICLLISRVFVFRHVLVSVPPEFWGKTLWRQFRIWCNGSSSKYYALRQESLSETPPDGLPIAWRESGKGFWGRFRTTLLLLLLVELPTVLLLLVLAGAPTSIYISQLILSLWGLSTLLITVHASMLITKERSRQTLELLLSTPLTSQEIARQKFAGTRRMIILCAMPLLTCIAFQSWWRGILPVPIRVPAEPPFVGLEYFVTAATCVAVYLPLVAWIALWMGLRYHHPTRATMAAIGAIGACSFASVILLLVTLSFVAPIRVVTGLEFTPLLVTATSPITMIYVTEFTNLRSLSSIPYLPAILNICIFGYIFRDIRRRVLEKSEFFLGRRVDY